MDKETIRKIKALYREGVIIPTLGNTLEAVRLLNSLEQILHGINLSPVDKAQQKFSYMTNKELLQFAQEWDEGDITFSTARLEYNIGDTSHNFKLYTMQGRLLVCLLQNIGQPVGPTQLAITSGSTNLIAAARTLSHYVNTHSTHFKVDNDQYNLNYTLGKR